MKNVVNQIDDDPPPSIALEPESEGIISISQKDEDCISKSDEDNISQNDEKYEEEKTEKNEDEENLSLDLRSEF